MPTPVVFGRIDKPEQLNLEPFDFTLVGYRENGNGREEVPYKFTVSGFAPFYVNLEIVQATAEHNGTLAMDRVIEYVERSLLNDEERERFREALAQPDVFFEGDVLTQIWNWLTEQYNDRPTRPRTARRSGRSGGGRRSTGAAGATASSKSAGSRAS